MRRHVCARSLMSFSDLPLIQFYVSPFMNRSWKKSLIYECGHLSFVFRSSPCFSFQLLFLFFVFVDSLESFFSSWAGSLLFCISYLIDFSARTTPNFQQVTRSTSITSIRHLSVARQSWNSPSSYCVLCLASLLLSTLPSSTVDLESWERYTTPCQYVTNFCSVKLKQTQNHVRHIHIPLPMKKHPLNLQNLQENLLTRIK